jgi:hypothetical protein
MMRRFKTSLFALAALVVPTAAAQAQAGPTGDCKLQIESASYSWVIEGYDPFDNSVPQGTYDVTFRNDGGTACRFFPAFVTDGSGLGLSSGGASRLRYTLYDMTSGDDVTPLAGRTLHDANSRIVEVAAGSQQLVRYELNVGVDTLPEDGRFTQRLFLVAEGDSNAEIASRNITVGINIRPSAIIGLSGAFRRVNGQADVDLGELRSGVAAVPLQLNVLSTRAYTLEFKSLNGGKLKLAGTEWDIPYRILLGDQSVDAAGGATVSPSSTTTTTQQDSLALGFDIGSVDNKRAGTYSDLITISVGVK